jgi:membrane protein YqaA with SNARE-associated domain
MQSNLVLVAKRIQAIISDLVRSIYGSIKTFVKSKLALNLLRVLVLIGVVTITVYLYTFRDQLKNLQGYGYLGIFLVSIVANATIIIPLPGVAVTYAMGTIFNPFLVGIAAGTGAALGELTGYMAGFSGQAVIENNEKYHHLLDWMTAHRRWSDLVIMGLAFIPNPFFDLAGMASGALRIPLWRFLIWVWIGKVMKMMVFAYAGAESIRLFFHP